MKSVAIINNCISRSTGKIAVGLHKYMLSQGYDSVLCYGRKDLGFSEEYYLIDSMCEVYFHYFMCKLTGYQGGFSYFATKRLIRELKSRRVDTIFLINPHGYYLNECLLFNYIAKSGLKLVYVMIDEYAYLGRCPYNKGCTKYLVGCGDCPQRSSFSFWGDASARIWQNKKANYKRIREKTVFCAPEFVINEAKKSPLMKDANLMVLDEAVDVSFFAPRDTAHLRSELHINDEQIVITCIAPMSQIEKGGKYFVDLARLFEKNPKYVFVHVGYDIHETNSLPSNYRAIGFINDQNKLADFYSLGDLFVFPSLQDTMSNACLEAMSAGNKILCFNISGMPYLGKEPIVKCVQPGSVEKMKDVILNTGKKSSEDIKMCRDYALSRYNNQNYFRKILDIALSL